MLRGASTSIVVRGCRGCMNERISSAEPVSINTTKLSGVKSHGGSNELGGPVE